MSDNVPSPSNVVDLMTIAIRSKDGVIRLFKSKVRLSAAAKTLVAPQGMAKKVGDRWVPTYLITAPGFVEMAGAAGITTVNASTVIVDGVAQPNPYMVRDSRGGAKMVYCRALAFGYTKLGVPVVSDRTVVFDLPMYRLVDLLGKAKTHPEAFKILPARAPSPGESWADYPVDDSTTLWADTSALEFIQWMAQMVNRARKAMEIAQTFAQRNAIKSHPNIPYSSFDGQSDVTVEIACWRPTEGVMRWDMSQFTSAVKQIEAMSTGGTGVDGGPVQVVRGTDELSQDPTLISAEAAVAADESDPVVPEEEKPAEEKPAELSAEDRKKAKAKLKKDFADLEALAESCSKEAWEVACKKVGFPVSGMIETMDSNMVEPLLTALRDATK